MNYKIILYAVFLLLGVFIFSGVNFDNIMKKNKNIEAWALVMSLSMALSYLVTNFIWDFIGL